MEGPGPDLSTLTMTPTPDIIGAHSFIHSFSLASGREVSARPAARVWGQGLSLDTGWGASYPMQRREEVLAVAGIK